VEVYGTGSFTFSLIFTAEDQKPWGTVLCIQ